MKHLIADAYYMVVKMPIAFSRDNGLVIDNKLMPIAFAYVTMK